MTMMTTNHLVFPARQAGDELPLVALHASASTGGQWRALAEALAGQRQVVTPDLPGYGIAQQEIDWRSWRGQDPVSLAGEAEHVLRSVGGAASGFHLVGHSFGGAVALKLALCHPQRVRSLTLIEPVLFHLLLRGSDGDMRLYREVQDLRDRVRGAVAAGRPAYGMAGFVDFWNGPGAWEAADAVQRQRLAAQARAVLRNFFAVLGETWPPEKLARLPMPVLTITGSESPAVTRRLVERIVDTAPNVTSALVFGAGHMAPITHGETVNCLIEQHLRRSEPVAVLRSSPAAA